MPDETTRTFVVFAWQSQNETRSLGQFPFPVGNNTGCHLQTSSLLETFLSGVSYLLEKNLNIFATIVICYTAHSSANSLLLSYIS